jgi:hydrogenase/urease accessory protein HupE
MKHFFGALLVMLVALMPPAVAHEVRPAYLAIDQAGTHTYSVVWKEPASGEFALHLVPHLSNGWLEKTPADQFATAGFVIRTWSISDAHPDPLQHVVVRIEGVENTMTDVLVRIHMANGAGMDGIVRPDKPSLLIDFAARNGLALPAYLRLGIEHILTGADHLMFVLGLLLLVGIRWELIKAITAFTVAHSITLALAALDLIQVPSAVIECLVALSIVFVASELVRDNKETLTRRKPWVIAFCFGLLHGMAFAGALAEVGLPKDAIPLSLFLFNVGVEIGQLLFVSVAIGAMLLWQLVRARLPRTLEDFLPRLPPYVIGTFAAFWFIGRVAVVFA